jgi:hypothetical protein
MATRVRHIFRWDLDKTYLRTEFDSVRALVRTARLSAEERENIPGSAALIRGIRQSASDDARHEIYFVSGSPEQLRSVIEKKFALDGFAPDGFVLKPAVSNLFRARFRAITSQVPYKLGALLGGRAQAPVGAKETLLGDDAESDAFIYAFYADLVRGAVGLEQLREVMKRARAYPDQVKGIERELEAVVHEPAVMRVVIHLDQLTPPAVFGDYFPLVVPIYNHLQTALVLVLDGTLTAGAVRAVARELLDQFAFDPARLTQSAEDIFRRRRAYTGPEAMGRLAADLRRLVSEDDARDTPTSPKDEALRETLLAIAERAEHVATRPVSLVMPIPHGVRKIDYVELFEREEARRNEAKKAKKAPVTKAPAKVDPPK